MRRTDPDGHRRIRPGERERAPVEWHLSPIALAVAVAWTVLAWPWLSGRLTVPWDAKAHFLPQVQFLAGSLARGELPLWNPYVFAGQPQIADPQSMIFSPPMLLLALFDRAPSGWAVDTTVYIAVLAGMLGLVLWVRDQGWHWAGAIIAAIGFGFGAAMAWRIQHVGQVLSLAYMPLALVCLDRAVLSGSLVNGLAAGAVGAAILLGRDQVALLVAYVLAGRVLWLWATAIDPWPALRRSLPPLVVAGVVAATLIAVPITFTVLLAGDSNRPAIDLEGAGRGSLHPAQLVTLLAPELFGAAGHMRDYWGPPSMAWQGTGLYTAQNVGQLYIGAVPALLLVIGSAAGRLWEPGIRFVTVALVVALLYALGWYTPVFEVLHRFAPGVALYRRPADAVFLIGAFASLAAGWVAHRMFTAPWLWPERRGWVVVGAVVAGVLVAALVLAWRMQRLGPAATPLVISLAAIGFGAVVLAWARSRLTVQPALAMTGLVSVLVADLAWHNGPSTSSALPTSHYDVLDPASRNETIALLKSKVDAVSSDTRRDRVELAGLGFHWPNASITHGLENTLGYNPVRIGHYSRATGAEDHVGLPEQRKLSPLLPSYDSLLADMLGLRWIATGAPIEQIDRHVATGRFPLVARTADGWVYENPRALPRVLFATSAEPADFDRLLADGQWPAFDPRRTVLLARTDLPPRRAPPPDASGQSRIVTYANNEVVIEAASSHGGWVVLNDIWHPWWQARVNGRDEPMLRANVIFRAVAVPAGRVEVRFAFLPLAGAWRQLDERWRRAR